MSTPSLANILVGLNLKALVQNIVDGTAPDVSFQGGIAWSPVALSNGNGANQANRWWQSQGRALGSGANETINLNTLAGLDIGAGAGNSPVGLAYANTRLVALFLFNWTSSAGKMVLGGQGTANAWLGPMNVNTSTLSYGPGGVHFSFDPTAAAFPIGGASNNLLEVAASGGAITYSILALMSQ